MPTSAWPFPAEPLQSRADLRNRLVPATVAAMTLARSTEATAADAPRAGDLMRSLSTVGADDLAQVFKAIADPVRLRLLSMISSAEGGEVCVCDLSEAFDLAPPTISYHLKILRNVGLVDGDRRGTWVYYRVVPEVLGGLGTMLTGSALSASARQARVSRSGGGAHRPATPGLA